MLLYASTEHRICAYCASTRDPIQMASYIIADFLVLIAIQKTLWLNGDLTQWRSCADVQ